MNLSRNFTLEELQKSQMAERKGINNTPDNTSISALKALAINVLQPVRDHFDRPVVISSGYRCSVLNALIGGSATSQHRWGQAADFEVVGHSNFEVAEWIRDNLNFDQLILEYYTPGDPNSGWVHCSFVDNEECRRNILSCKVGPVYLQGLVLS